MSTYTEKIYSRTMVHDARTGARAVITWTDIDWDDWDQIPRAKLWACHDENPKIRCMRVERKAIGVPTSAGRYEKCEVTATYEVPKIGEGEGEDDPTYPPTINADMAVDAVTVDGTPLKWTNASGKDITGTQPTITVPLMTINASITKKTVPFSKIRSCLGKINDSTFSVRGASLKAGTVLFVGANTQERYDKDGNVLYDITYSIQYQPHGWNYLPYNSGTAPIDWKIVYPALYESTSLDWL